MADIDIIIPLYNKAKTIERSIRSIQGQTVTNWRLIVVDDGSTDGGAAIVEQLALADKRIYLIRQENKGTGAARNAGLAHVQTLYTAFLDADDEWHPQYLHQALDALSHNNIAMVGCYYYRWPEKLDMTPHWRQRGVRPGVFTLRGNEDPAWVSNLMSVYIPTVTAVQTAAARECGGFYDKTHACWGEDQTLFLRLAIRHPFMILEQTTAYFHMEDSFRSAHRRPQELPVFIADPQAILTDCPTRIRSLMEQVIAHRVLGVACSWAYAGEKARASELIKQWPSVRQFKRGYRRYLYFRYIRPRWWTRFKCWVGPPVRMKLREWAFQLGLKTPPPALPSEDVPTSK
ncbi:MAG: glycosyltransferase family 2 protein [Sedimentisphaerales bacterium]|nr:glycosyltransferase family 2 protein [Sedimentisphaerales bacterium]